MNSVYFNFYNTFYKMGYLDFAVVHEAARWGVINLDEFKLITGQTFEV